jgi:hypothetical protein
MPLSSIIGDRAEHKSLIHDFSQSVIGTIDPIRRSGTIGRTVGVEPYAKRHPAANDIDLLVELADATSDNDRKAPRTYEASGIGAYRIVNLVDRQIEVYTAPTEHGYDIKRVDKLGKKVPIEVHGTTAGYIAVSDALLYPTAIAAVRVLRRPAIISTD